METPLQLKAAVYLSVAQIVEAELARMGPELAASPTFVATLVELTYNQIVNFGEDLELFAKHASRQVVKPTDVYMVTRKNPVLTKALKDLESSL
ncbi:hypothetical protein PGUG_02763 [Meyerozyma guilliermondii ATCC 6260]|uniref:Centromere protein S n=1 Tax=Meyerozyma guilliermondii (strain ATCC 6260 / CBS 566 / DSM 6381 / JCM 1539 / NBRC 10279 / NRRL Y-324) TaxID=294746 RepID=A5DHL2_PICGU|nr:uncharacterized protein PGUG_02763 [Meyerozyma guilliermondii ATCC 6260]EDK38665.2 hypothetical protein PGUG_02763 [Meyerozyma guilliermondii ATCC 6260]